MNIRFYSFSGMFVGGDAHIDPAERTVFTEISGEFDVGIAPYEHSGKLSEIP